MAEETVLEKGLSFMDPFKGLLLTYFMPESCYDEFFLNFNFLDGKCPLLVGKLAAQWPKRHTEDVLLNVKRNIRLS